MEMDVKSLDGEVTGELELPKVFEEDIRPDVIRRAFHSAQSSRKQPKGTDSRAGMDTSAETPPKGTGRTRVRRVKGRGYHAAGMAAWAPFTRGGRRAHPLKSEEEKAESLNRKEKDLAVRSAISATKDRKVVSSRGHVIDEIDSFPIVLADDLEEIEKTREVKEFLEKIGAWKDVERVKKGSNIRAGRGKSRERPYRKGVGPLLVIGKDRGIVRGARNIPGVDVIPVEALNAELLAPGGVPGRLTIWTEGAVKSLDRRFSS